MNLRHPFLAVAAALALLFTAAPAFAQNPMVSDAWARASPGAVKNGAAFMTIMNHGAADRLISAAAPVSAKTELHNHINDNGVMRMRKVPAIDIPAGETVTLKPGGLHVMFMGLKAPLQEGGSFPLALTFEKAGTVTVQVPVKKAGAMGHGKKMGDKKTEGMNNHGHKH